jgi:lipopolysaccharide export system protein LptA
MHVSTRNKSLKSTPLLPVFVLTFFILISSFSFAQEKKMVEILKTGYAESVTGLGVNTQRLVDSVLIRHEDILMWCDTAYMYTGTNKVDAIGKVHISQGDTLDLYANYVFYNGDIGFARAWNDVSLINKSTTLTSDTLEYDLENNITYFDDNGKIVDSTTTITSETGKYFIDDNQIYFYNKVVGYNEDFTLKSDTVMYNTETGKMFVDGPTTITDSVNTLYTEKGWYDSKTGETELKKKSIIYGETQELQAQYIKYNKETGTGFARGKVRIEDAGNTSIVLGNVVEYSENLETAIVTDSAVYITYTESDSLFLHADTLKTVPDTIPGEKIVTAYRGVRFFKTDIQGLCDSLVYFTKDSVIQLHQNPVIWSEIHQLSADLIEMKQVLNGADELHLTNNSFIISKQDSNQFDQIKGKEMIGFIVNQELDKIDVNGNGQTLYYAREENEIIGLNKAESSKISIRFKEGKIFKIILVKSPEGELKPLLELTAEDKKLSGFDWKIKQRPLTKHDIFPKSELNIETESLENKKEIE